MICWGYNPDVRRDYPPGVEIPPVGLVGVVQLSAGDYHNCALKVDGTVVCWGANWAGQATPPSGLASVVQVTAGNSHTCTLKTDETVICWGTNYYGQSTPPPGLTAVAQISAGSGHTCALRADGTVTCWGDSQYGQATPPTGLVAVAQINAGGTHTCAVKTDGTVVCWGSNWAGQATPPPGLGSVAQVTGGASHTCAVKIDGTVACWGDPLDYDNTIAQPAELAGVSQLEAGLWHTCALKGDGTVVCWGETSYGKSTPPTGLNLFSTVTDPLMQAITFSPAPTSTALISTNAVLTATGGGSGNPVIFSSLTAAVCTVSGSSVSYVTIGTCIIAADQAGNDAYLAAPRVTASVAVIWPFTGFMKPIANPPTLNSVKAGGNASVKFSLGSNRGLSILAAGSPTSIAISCASPNPVTGTATTTTGTLTYDSVAGSYVYGWKTDKTYAGTCRRLTVLLADGTTHTAMFTFK